MRAAWTSADFGEAMIDHYTTTWPSGWRRRSDGIEGPAFHRGGDNPTSFRIISPRGVAMDARASRSYSAREYAEAIAGMTLAELMVRHGRMAVRAATPSAPNRERSFPPSDEVADLWSRCIAACDDVDLRTWLERRLGPDAAVRVVDYDVARALPPRHLPSWARCIGVSWAQGGYRCMIACFDAKGALRSVRARCIEEPREGLPKEASPSRYTSRGLAFADTLGRGLLEGDAHTRAHVVRVSRETARPGVVIVEGAPAWLAWTIDASDADEDAPAVLGIGAGAWSAEHAARIPDGARIIIDTDHDPAGDAYAKAIGETLRFRDVIMLRARRREAHHVSA